MFKGWFLSWKIKWYDLVEWCTKFSFTRRHWFYCFLPLLPFNLFWCLTSTLHAIVKSWMFLVFSFEKLKRQKEEAEKLKWQKEEANRESEAMDGAQGCVLSRRPSFFGLDHVSIQTSWYLLAYILLARNGLLKDVWKTIFEKEMYTSSVEHMGFKKRRTMIKTRPGGNHNGHESNGCFIPGLCDDVALDSLARIDLPSKHTFSWWPFI